MVDVEDVQVQGFVLEEDKIDDALFDYIDNYPEGNNNKDDDDDQGLSGLLIVNLSLQQKTEDFLNDEINEQEEDHQQESSSSGKQHVDHYEFKYAQEADKYDEVIVEEASDSSDEETNFHYSCVDDTFPSLAEIFKDQKED
ncbi:hypothetical protein Hanom_Chr07g00626581 [Helianthus anomalus]